LFNGEYLLNEYFVSANSNIPSTFLTASIEIHLFSNTIEYL
jgi:hypothetical protein